MSKQEAAQPTKSKSFILAVHYYAGGEAGIKGESGNDTGESPGAAAEVLAEIYATSDHDYGQAERAYWQVANSQGSCRQDLFENRKYHYPSKEPVTGHPRT